VLPFIIFINEVKKGVGVEVGTDDFGRDLRDDGIAVGAQLSHSGGNPMSQQTNAGFNAPGFSVGAPQPHTVRPSSPFVSTLPQNAPSLWSREVGVGHIAAVNFAAMSRFSPPIPLPGYFSYSTAFRACQLSQVSPPPLMRGVGHKPQSISAMGRIDGTSRDNGRPAGVADAFQVRMHSVEPILANRCRNLLSHDDRGPAGTDEAEEDGPEVAVVLFARAFAGDGEGLAGARSGPERPIVSPTGEPGGKRPSTDPGEEVALGVFSEIVWSDIGNASFVNVAGRDVAGRDQVAQPLGRIRVELVVIGGHALTPARFIFSRSRISAAFSGLAARHLATCAAPFFLAHRI
jgi:hypothetical protein